MLSCLSQKPALGIQPTGIVSMPEISLADASDFLENELREHDQQLYNNLQEVKHAARKIFNLKTFPLWFTDHGENHSRHLIYYIYYLIRFLDPTLSAAELFVLLTSCYLHDIGMWDLRLPAKEAPYGLEDYIEIRRRHPQRSAELININSFPEAGSGKLCSLEIPNAYKLAVMLVSKAHGTDFFNACIEELEGHHIDSGTPFRGPMVAALMLMADELDLTQWRIETLLAQSPLTDYSPETYLHLFRHHYIRHIKLDSHLGNCCINLSFEFPPHSVDYQNDLTQWVAAKLRRQCALTQPSLQPHGLRWDRVIKYQVQEDKYGIKTPLDEKPFNYLRYLTESRNVVNREALLGKLGHLVQGYFTDSCAMLIYGNKDSDLESIDEWVQSACSWHQIAVIGFKFLKFESFDKEDIINKMKSIRSQGKRAVMVLSILPDTDETLKNWLTGDGLLGELHVTDGPPLSVILLFGESPVLLPEDGFVVETLGPFTKEQIRRHLEDKIGCPHQDQVDDILVALDPAAFPPRLIAQKFREYQRLWLRNI